MADSRIVVVPFDCDSDFNDVMDHQASSPTHEHPQRNNNPSQNNNAKRARVYRPYSSPPERDRARRSLKKKNIRKNPDQEMIDPDQDSEMADLDYENDPDWETIDPDQEVFDIDVEEEEKVSLPLVPIPVTRSDLICDPDDFSKSPCLRPPFSVAGIRLVDLPHPIQQKYQGHNRFGFGCRTKEQDILNEWRNAGLIRHGGGVAFEVPLGHPNPGGRYRPPRQRRAHWLTNGDEVKRKLEEKQRKASERRKRVQSARKERIHELVHERKKLAKVKCEEEEDFKQRITHAKIIEKQSKCAENRVKRQTEFEQRMEERRRRRDKVRKRARRAAREDQDDNDRRAAEGNDDGNPEGPPPREDNNEMNNDEDDDDDTDQYAESVPQQLRLHFPFD